MKHLVFFSGGSASWYVAYRIKKEHGNEALHLLFTDTLIEDNDLYRFIIETAANIFEVSQVRATELIQRANDLPLVYTDMDARKEALEQLRLDTVDLMPRLHWLSEQRDVWDVFYDVRFLGNSRVAHCSAQLKQRMAKRYVKPNFDAESTKLYLGIDWTEDHRTNAPRKNWAPFKVEFPLVDDMTFNKIDIMKALEVEGVEPPRLYAMGFAHNNCGGFCVRAGQGHFANLLEKNRELYLYHERREREFIEWRGADVAILKRSKTHYVDHAPYEIIKGVEDFYLLEDYETYVTQAEGWRERVVEVIPLTLEQLRKELDAKQTQEIDFYDVGGCGCFVTEE